MAVNIILSIITGVFALLSAFLAWKLKTAQDKKSWALSLAKERRSEVKELYTEAFALFEQAIQQVNKRNGFTLGQDFAKLNAKIHLLAPEHIVAQYDRVAVAIAEWSSLYERASPQLMRAGEKTYALIQAPDPTAKYREPAKNAYEELQGEIHKLVALMRADLAAHGKTVEEN